MADVENLDIKIEVASAEAAGEIDNLTKKLKQLESAVKWISSAPDKIKNISNSAKNAAENLGKSTRETKGERSTTTQNVASKRGVLNRAAERIKNPTQEVVDKYKIQEAKLSQQALKLKEQFASLGKTNNVDLSQYQEIENKFAALADTSKRVRENVKQLQSLLEQFKSGSTKGVAQQFNSLASSLAESKNEAKLTLEQIKLLIAQAKSNATPNAPVKDEQFGKDKEQSSSALAKFSVGLQEVMTASSGFGKALGVVKATMSLLATVAKKAASALFELGKNMVSLSLQGLGKGLSAVGKGILGYITKPFTNALKAVNKWKSAIGRVAFYRLVRSAIKMVTDGFSEGIQNLYKYSSAMGTAFAPAMDSIASSSLYLKNSLAAMAAPLIQIVAPAIQYVINMFVQLLNAINQIFAVLGGGGVFTKAKKQTTEWGDAMGSAGGAAKKLKDYMLGIDELNVINDNQGGGGGGGAAGLDYESMFEESALSGWAQSMKDAIEQGDWYGAGEILAGKVNELIDAVPWGDWGVSFGTNINNAISFGLGFIRNIDWVSVGKGIATFLNNAIQSINPTQLGQLLAQKIQAIFSLAYGFVTTFDFSAFGTWLGTVFQGWFDEINWERIATTVSLAVIGIFDAIKSAFLAVDWASIGTTVADSINNINWEKTLTSVSGSIVTGLNSLVDAVGAFMPNLNWAKVGAALGQAINDLLINFNWGGAFNAIGEFLKGLVTALSEAIANIELESVGRTLVDALGEVDWAGLLMSLGGLVWELFKGALSLAVGVNKGFWDIGKNIVEGLWEGIKNAMSDAVTWLDENLVTPVVDWVKDLFGIHSPSTVFEDMGEDLDNGLFNGIANNWSQITDFFSTEGQNIITFFSNTWEDIKNGASEKWENIKSALSSKWSDIKTNVDSKFEEVKIALSTKWDEIKTDAGTKWENIKEEIANIWSNAKTEAKTWGSDLMQSFADGIDRAKNKVQTAIGNVLTWIKNHLHFSEPDEGPLSDFHTWAPDMMKSWASGISANAHLVQKAVSEAVSTVSGTSSTLFSDDIFSEDIKTNLNSKNNKALSDTASRVNSNLQSGGNDNDYSNDTDTRAEEIALLREQNDLLREILAKPTDVILDGKTIKRSVDNASREAGAEIMTGGIYA